jgi:hypothetical protein
VFDSFLPNFLTQLHVHSCIAFFHSNISFITVTYTSVIQHITSHIYKMIATFEGDNVMAPNVQGQETNGATSREYAFDALSVT